MKIRQEQPLTKGTVQLQWWWSMEETCVDTRSVWSLQDTSQRFWVLRGSESRVLSLTSSNSFKREPTGFWRQVVGYLRAKRGGWILFRDTCQYMSSGWEKPVLQELEKIVESPSLPRGGIQLTVRCIEFGRSVVNLSWSLCHVEVLNYGQFKWIRRLHTLETYLVAYHRRWQ